MSMQKLFYPKSIAMIGASRREKTVGNDVVKNLVQQGYQGKIYPVNPKAEELYGLKVYASVEEVPGDIDLAVIAVPAKFVTESVKQAAQKGAQAAVVISAGFKEIGKVELEEELAATCQELGVDLVGPNCLGVINSEINMNASFAALMPEQGDIAFISQSGALCTAVLDYASDLGIGFSKFMSIGNKASTDELKLIKYLKDDPQTKVIALYVEQLENAPEIIKVIKEINQSDNPKPIIMLKSGRTDAGASAVASHTGSLSGGDAAYDALFAQAGIIRAQSIAQLFEFAQIFSKNELAQAKKVCIVTNAGGPGVLTTDEAIKAGLELAELSADTKKALTEFLPEAASVKNPVDVLGDARADRYEKTLELVEKDPNVDSVLLIMTPQSMTEIVETAQAAVAIKNRTQKPLVVSFMGQPTVAPGVEIMRQANIATSTFPEPAARSLGTLDTYFQIAQNQSNQPFTFDDVDKDSVAEIFNKAKAEGRTSFPEAEALAIMKAYNFPLLQSQRAATKEEALQVAKKIGTRMAMKIVSPDILHKSDVGGVMLNVTIQDVEAKFEEMMATVSKNKPKAKLEGVLLMEMAPDYGTETILGVNKAAGLGTMVMFGIGGIYVEVLKDVQFAYAPITKADAERMVNSLRMSEVFHGVRGQKAFDVDKIVENIGRLAQLVTDFPQIVELDINPLLVLPKGEGAKVLDARVVIE